MAERRSAEAEADADVEAEDVDTETEDVDVEAEDVDAEADDVDVEAEVTEDRPRLSAAEAGREGLQQIIELTGRDPEAVTGVARSKSGWLVTVDVVEDRRIPSSTDIMATYEAELDADGELLSYQRVRRYSRGHGDDKDL